MDNPGVSLFQNADINLNNSRNQEEEEDIEDQKRRNEELQNLLMTKLDDFNYDESTVNSSIISAISCDDNQSKYLKTENQQEQLKVLYEIRLRELQTLKDDYKKTTDKMTKDMDALKKKLLLSEAEVEQLKFSYKNSDDLLVEKTCALKELTASLENKNKQIQDYEKTINDMHIEISSYKTTINNLHLQLQSDMNPISNINKKFNSEEYKKANQEQIMRLESLLEENVKSAKLIEKENIVLKEELNKLIASNNDDATLIKALTRNFESAQRQCEELIDVVETLTNENKHLQERVNNIYQNTSVNERNSLDSLTRHVDKLKKMLVDKSVQNDTLSVKLQNYEENLKELLEYRKLKSDAYQKEFQTCDNQDHTKNLLLMQNDLQNYRRIIEDKNQQILNLNSTNKDLLARMEENLSQTRTDIKNFSNKYSLPQLEKMAEDLKSAQDYIQNLEEKLKISEEKRLSTSQKENNKEIELKKELETLKLVTEKERNNFENEIKKLKQELDVALVEINNVKRYTEELVTENVQLKSSQIKTTNDDGLKTQYLESIKALHEAKSKIQLLQDAIDELTNLKTIVEGEKCTYEFEVKDYQNKLDNCKKYINNLETELENASKDLKNKEEIIIKLKETVLGLKDKIKIGKEINLQLDNKLKELKNKDEIIHNLQETVISLKEELSSLKQIKINEENQEINECPKCKNFEENKDVHEVDNAIRRNLEDELKEIEDNDLERKREADIVSLEVKLREEIQEEYFKKIKDIEHKYQKVYNSSKDLCKEQEDKLKKQELKFREHMALILGECSQKIKEYEHEIEQLIKHMRNLQSQYDEQQIKTKTQEHNFKKLIEELQLSSKRDAEKWNLWSKKLINSCLKIESTNKRSRDNIFFKMQTYDSEVAAIEKSYETIKNMITSTKK